MPEDPIVIEAGARVPPVLVGQSLEPQVVVEAPWEATYEWIISGNVFKDYIMSDDHSTAIKEELSDADKNHSYVSYYWASVETGLDLGVQGYESQAVSVQVELNDGGSVRYTGTRSTSVDVWQPQWKLEADLRVDRLMFGYFDKNGQLFYGNADYCQRIMAWPQGTFPDYAGIRFTGKVTVPGGFEEGEFCFLQLVTPGDGYQTVGGIDMQFSLNGELVLDNPPNGFAYPPDKYGQLDQLYPDGIFPTNMDGDATVSDSPGSVLLPDHRFVYRSDSFQMYLMFRPKYGNWVPLGRVDWSLYDRIERILDLIVWMDSLDPEEVTTWKGATVGTDDHPQWSHKYTQGQWKYA